MASKGRKKPSLFSLSRQPISTDEERNAYFKSLRSESDRVVAIRASAFTEHTLLDLLIESMRTMDESDIEHLFFKNNATLGTFAARVDIARAFNLINEKQKKNLDIIRHIRNTFAHAVVDIDFSTKEISDECLKLDCIEPESKNPRHIYTVGCHNIAVELKDILIEILKKRLESAMIQEQRQSPNIQGDK